MRMTNAGTVIIVDDQRELLEEFVEAIAGKGMNCTGYVRAEPAIERVKADASVDILITDLRMPGINGIDILNCLRQEIHEPRYLQIIMITGHATSDDLSGQVAFNVFEFLYKPILADALLQSIRAARAHRFGICS